YFLENPNLTEDLRKNELRQLRNILKFYFVNLKSLRRIECFDVAHLAGNSPTASMVTFIKGEPDKNFYRHFKIRQKEGQNDIESLREVIKRRLKYLDKWGKPDLIIVDGGRGQVKAFTSILYGSEVVIPVVGIAKNPDRLITKDKKVRLQGATLHFVSRIRDEAHRFARRYHHKLIRRQLLTPKA
ncbi:excinuclease ABC subunit C, partial [Candidatus Woesebacteria bacterium]|nr:excinuclease ABC subunit C [Candidatus Woesebacteria bacterium]